MVDYLKKLEKKLKNGDLDYLKELIQQNTYIKFLWLESNALLCE